MGLAEEWKREERTDLLKEAGCAFFMCNLNFSIKPL